MLPRVPFHRILKRFAVPTHLICLFFFISISVRKWKSCSVLCFRDSQSDSCTPEEFFPISREHGGAQGLPVRYDQTVQQQQRKPQVRIPVLHRREKCFSPCSDDFWSPSASPPPPQSACSFVLPQEPAAVLRMAGLDALSVLHQSKKQRGAENHRDGVRHLPHSALPRHQVWVGRLARLGGHTVHHPLQGQGARYIHGPLRTKATINTDFMINFYLFVKSCCKIIESVIFCPNCYSTFLNF